MLFYHGQYEESVLEDFRRGLTDYGLRDLVDAINLEAGFLKVAIKEWPGERGVGTEGKEGSNEGNNEGNYYIVYLIEASSTPIKDVRIVTFFKISDLLAPREKKTVVQKGSYTMVINYLQGMLTGMREINSKQTKKENNMTKYHCKLISEVDFSFEAEENLEYSCAPEDYPDHIKELISNEAERLGKGNFYVGKLYSCGE